MDDPDEHAEETRMLSIRRILLGVDLLQHRMEIVGNYCMDSIFHFSVPKSPRPGANADMHFIPKIERADSIPNMQSIIAASDGVRL
ncbi:hypothetical protein ACQ4PT_066674 [Festuca glaucescens]